MMATMVQQRFTVPKVQASSWAFAVRVWPATILALFVGCCLKSRPRRRVRS
jgi:hypothetical protein